MAELQSERANHQKLINEHRKLESRFDKARSDLLKYRNMHLNASSSNESAATAASTSINVDNALLESLIEELDLDSIRDKSGESKETNGTTTTSVRTPTSSSAPQLKVTSATPEVKIATDDEENEKQGQYERDYDIIKSQELELENHRLRDDLNRLRKLYDDNEGDGAINHEIKCQFNALNEELQRRRDECIQLKTILVNQSRQLQNSKLKENKDLRFDIYFALYFR